MVQPLFRSAARLSGDLKRLTRVLRKCHRYGCRRYSLADRSLLAPVIHPVFHRLIPESTVGVHGNSKVFCLRSSGFLPLVRAQLFWLFQTVQRLAPVQLVVSISTVCFHRGLRLWRIHMYRLKRSEHAGEWDGG